MNWCFVVEISVGIFGRIGKDFGGKIMELIRVKSSVLVWWSERFN